MVSKRVTEACDVIPGNHDFAALQRVLHEVVGQGLGMDVFPKRGQVLPPGHRQLALERRVQVARETGNQVALEKAGHQAGGAGREADLGLAEVLVEVLRPREELSVAERVDVRSDRKSTR